MRIFVSPHLDDAVFSAWVSLSASAASVVTCFTADPAESVSASHWDKESNPGLTGKQIMEIRRESDKRALALCHASFVHLDLPEIQYRGPGTPLEADDLAGYLEPHLGDAEELWLPAGIGGHPDHVLVHRASRLVVPAAARLVFYADQPYAASRARGWPISIDRKPGTVALELVRLATLRRTALRRWNEDLATSGLSDSSLKRHVIDLSPEQVSEKMAAVHTYRTQAKALGYTDDTALMARTLLAHEVFWTYT